MGVGDGKGTGIDRDIGRHHHWQSSL
jgi:hypothetical protein